MYEKEGPVQRRRLGNQKEGVGYSTPLCNLCSRDVLFTNRDVVFVAVLK